MYAYAAYKYVAEFLNFKNIHKLLTRYDGRCLLLDVGALVSVAVVLVVVVLFGVTVGREVFDGVIELKLRVLERHT